MRRDVAPLGRFSEHLLGGEMRAMNEPRPGMRPGDGWGAAPLIRQPLTHVRACQAVASRVIWRLPRPGAVNRQTPRSGSPTRRVQRIAGEVSAPAITTRGEQWLAALTRRI